MTALPVTITPRVNEAWAGYLARVAARYRCRVEDLGRHLGLRNNNRWPAHHGITLDQNLTERVSEKLGLQPGQVTAMHLQRWDGTALAIGAIVGVRSRPWPIVPLSWTYLTHPRRCTSCRAEDHIDLTWHLPWITHCTRHGAALDSHQLTSTGLVRNTALLHLLDQPTATFAGERIPASTALRAWLETALLIAASQARPNWRTPPTSAEADHWLSHASQIASANSPEEAVGQVLSTINERSVRASRYTQANLYSPPLRNLIDDALARWHRPARDR